MIVFIPSVTCLKCNKPVMDVRRVYEPNSAGGRRYIQARCHGEIVELPFADEARQEMKICEPKEN
jgi:hypothetical protein